MGRAFAARSMVGCLHLLRGAKRLTVACRGRSPRTVYIVWSLVHLPAATSNASALHRGSRMVVITVKSRVCGSPWGKTLVAVAAAAAV